ncbi:MAG: DUF1667 domain-containing protein [Hafnia sp.]
MLKSFICIICPNGCPIQAEVAVDGTVLGIKGYTCPRGEEYVHQELTNPCRNISTSVPVSNGELPLVSVRLTAPIPKHRIFDVMEQIDKQHLVAPVYIGDVICANVLNLGVDVIATKTIPHVNFSSVQQ